MTWTRRVQRMEVTRTAHRLRPLRRRRCRRRRMRRGRLLRLYTALKNVFSLLPSTLAFSRLMLRRCWPAARYMPPLRRVWSHSPDIEPRSLRDLDVVACPSREAPPPSLRPHSPTSPWYCSRPLRPSLILPSTRRPRYVSNTSSLRSCHYLRLYVCRHAPHALPRPS